MQGLFNFPQAVEGVVIDIPERGIHVPLKCFSTCHTSKIVYLIKCGFTNVDFLPPDLHWQFLVPP